LSPARAGGEDAEAYSRVQNAIAEAANAAGVELIHPGQMQEAGTIISQIRRYIRSADVVIAVVTGQNANVFYELGYSRRPAILIGRSKDDIPFDVKADRYWTYGGMGELETLSARLTDAIRQTVARRPRSSTKQSTRRFAELAQYPLPKASEADLYDVLGVA